MSKGKLRNAIATTFGVGALVFGLSVGPANADVLDGWNLNLSLLNGGFYDDGTTALPALSDITNIDHFDVSGQSTVVQTWSGGAVNTPFGQGFTDDGFLNSFTYVPEGGFTTSLLGSTGGLNLQFVFTGLEGTLNADNTISFDPNVGSVSLYLASGGTPVDGATDTSTYVTLATFDIVDPSGGSNLFFFGGAGADATIDITLVENGTPIANLFTSAGGTPLTSLNAFHLGNVNALLLDQTPTAAECAADPDCTSTTLTLDNGGQYNVRVPEPGTLGLLGIALLGFGFAGRRRLASKKVS